MLSARTLLHLSPFPPRLCKSPKLFYFYAHSFPMATATQLTPAASLLPAFNSPASNSPASKLGRSSTGVLEIGGFSVEGVSIGGQETCVMIPAYRIAFDIGRCPQRAVTQDFLFVSHGHMDHIGGVCFYVATRGLYRMKPPTIVVPKCLVATVEKLFEVHRELDGSELRHQLIGLDVGW